MGNRLVNMAAGRPNISFRTEPMHQIQSSQRSRYLLKQKQIHEENTRMVNRIINVNPRVFDDAAARATNDRSQFITAAGTVKRVDLTKPRRRNAGQGKRISPRGRSSSPASTSSHTHLPYGHLTIGDVRKIYKGGVYLSPRTGGMAADREIHHPDPDAGLNTDGSDPGQEHHAIRVGSRASNAAGHEGGTFLTQGVEVVSPSSRVSGGGSKAKGTPYPRSGRSVEHYKPWRQNMVAPTSPAKGVQGPSHRRGGSHFDMDTPAGEQKQGSQRGSLSARIPGAGRRSPRRPVRRAGEAVMQSQSAPGSPQQPQEGVSPSRRQFKERMYSRPWASGSPTRQRHELNPPPEGFLQRSPPRFPARGGAGEGSPRRARSTSPRSRHEVTKAWIEKKRAPAKKPGFGGSSARGGMFGTRGAPSITKSPLKNVNAASTSTLSSTRNYSKPWVSGRVSPVDTAVNGGVSPRAKGGAATDDSLSKFTKAPSGRKSPRMIRGGGTSARVTPLDVRRAIGLTAAGSTSLQGHEGKIQQGSLTIAALLGSGGRTSPRGGSSRLDHASMY